MKENILVLGSINIDYVTFTKRFPRPGETITGSDFSIFQGGKGANQAIAISKLGCPTWMLGKVGDDQLKQSALKTLQKNNVNTDFVEISQNVSTGSASIWVNKKGENSIIIYPGANGEVDTKFIAKNKKAFLQAQWFLSQFEIPLSSVMQGLKIARENNIFTVVDPAPAQKISNCEFWNLVDFLLPNEIEIQDITGKKDLLESIIALKARGVKEIVVKMGARGACYEKNNQLIIIPGNPVKHIVDTTGAGDCFTAGFVKGIIEFHDIEKAIKLANYASSYSIQKKGAAISFPTEKEILRNGH